MASNTKKTGNSIGILNENSIHNDIKAAYSKPGDRFEEKIDGYIVDIARKNLLIEIQTANFLKIRDKIETLVKKYKLRLVHNIPAIKWIIKVDEKGAVISKRRSRKKGDIIDLFKELIYIPRIVNEEKFSLEVLFTEEEELRKDDGKGSWRRKGVSIEDRRMIRILDRKCFKKSRDFLSVLPASLPEVFSTRDIAGDLMIDEFEARRILYFFKKSGLIRQVGKKGNLLKYIKASQV